MEKKTKEDESYDDFNNKTDGGIFDGEGTGQLSLGTNNSNNNRSPQRAIP